jgi:hypothetical protein
MRPFVRGKYLDERQRQSPEKAADSHIRWPQCGGWSDVSDLGSWLITPGRYRISRSEILKG